MANNKRKKKQKNADFKKVKFKVGQKRPKGANETETSFKSQGIVVPLKDMVKEGSLTNAKKQNLRDLLVHLNHYSSTVRQDSLVGLRALFKQHESELHDNISLVFNSVFGKVTDTDPDVRHSLLLLLQHILPKMSSDQIGPFLPLMVAHLSSAMTHIYGDIQLQSLEFLSLLLELFPKQMKRHCVKIIDNLLGLISRDNSGNSSALSAKSKVSTIAEGRLAPQKSKLKILNQILECLKIVYDAKDTIAYSSDLFDKLDMPQICFEHGKANYIPLFPNVYQEKFATFSFESQSGLDQTQELSGIKEFVQKVVPLLLEFWVECSPSQLASSLENSTISSSKLSEMITIMDVFKILLHVLCKEDSTAEVRSWFSALYLKDFKTHFMKFFPFQVSFLSKAKGKSKSPDATNCNSILMLNVSVCEVMSIFTANATSHKPWIKALQEYIAELLEASSPNKFKTQHLNSVLMFVENILQNQVLCEMESTNEIIESLYQIYLSSHLFSTLKVKILKFFAVLYFKLNVSGFKVSAQLQSILNRWVKSLPKLLVKSNVSNLETINTVIKLLSKLINQRDGCVETMELQKVLTSFLVPGALHTLPTQNQKSLVELIFSLPKLDNGLLKALAMCCNQRQLSVDVVQYLLHALHYRSSPSLGFIGKSPTVSLSSYLSFLFSAAIGFTDKDLSNLQTNRREHCMCTYDLVEGCNSDAESTSQIWQRQQKILEVVFKMYQQLSHPKKLLKQMEPAMESLLESKKTLPVSAAGSMLKLFKCFVTLANSPTKEDDQCFLSTSFVTMFAELSLSCINFSLEENSSFDAEILACIYNDATEVLEASPLVLKHFLDTLSTTLEDEKLLVILAKLLQSFHCGNKSGLFSCCAAQIINAIMEKVSMLHCGSPHFSNLQYQYSLYTIEVNRRRREEENRKDASDISK